MAIADKTYYQEQCAKWMVKVGELEEQLEKTQKENTRLENLVYVPGVTVCPKCKLRLLSTTLDISTGNLYADAKPQDCANGCGPMWKVTERDERKDAQKAFTELFEKVNP